MAGIIEKLFSHGKEIQEVLNTYSDRKQAVKEIMKLYPEISNSENAISSNLTQFKAVYPELQRLKQKNEQLETDNNLLSENLNILNAELNKTKSDNSLLTESLNSLNTELNKFKTDNSLLTESLNNTQTSLNGMKTENEKSASEKCLLIKEVNKLKAENEMLSANNSLMINEINNFKQKELPITEQEVLPMETQTLNNTQTILNSDLESRVSTLESVVFQLKNRLNSLTMNEVVRAKKEGIKKIGKWNIVLSGGFYRVFRQINGIMRGVYIGRQFNDELAITKITAKGLPID